MRSEGASAPELFARAAGAPVDPCALDGRHGPGPVGQAPAGHRCSASRRFRLRDRGRNGPRGTREGVERFLDRVHEVDVLKIVTLRCRPRARQDDRAYSTTRASPGRSFELGAAWNLGLTTLAERVVTTEGAARYRLIMTGGGWSGHAEIGTTTVSVWTRCCSSSRSEKKTNEAVPWSSCSVAGICCIKSLHWASVEEFSDKNT